MINLAFQPELRPALPPVFGPIEYRELRQQFEIIDRILLKSGLEEDFLSYCLETIPDAHKPRTRKSLDFFVTSRRVALRSCIARGLVRQSYRDFTIRLAESGLIQWFTMVGRLDQVKAFAKSSAHRHEQYFDAEALREFNNRLMRLLSEEGAATETGETIAELIGLEVTVSFDQIWCDTTCLEANIHFPVDWVLMRDAVRTLMKAVVLIRREGLKNRMPQDPLCFLSEINTLCMQMTASGRKKKKGKRERKRILRLMKKLSKKVAKHAEAHLKLLTTRVGETELSEAQAQQIINRIESVLEQLPTAMKQAHERIIGGRSIASKNKILSLYDPDAEVIVRGKSGARVEYGNKFWLAENRDGLIVDYKLLQEQSADSTLVKPALERLFSAGFEVKEIWGDRGLSSVSNTKTLDAIGIRDGLCPRAVDKLSRQLEEDQGFREGLKRRASTEARVAIIGRVFLGEPLRAKGFKNRERAVGWSVLTHNLWVVARMIQVTEKRRAQARAA